jgi:hypothetical protein
MPGTRTDIRDQAMSGWMDGGVDVHDENEIKPVEESMTK